MTPDLSRPTAAPWTAAIAAVVLRRGAMIHALSRVLTVVAILGTAFVLLVRQPTPVWLATAAVMAVAGAIEFWLAARVAIDADLFEALARHADDLDGFDQAMRDLGLLSAAKTARALPDRVRAAFRLLRLQGAALVVQVAVLLAGAACA
jgi:hypothetical protein